MSVRHVSLAMVALLGTAAAQNYPVLLRETSASIEMDGKDTRTIVAGDFDGDGDTDLFAANFGQKNIVYRNDGFGNFEIVPDFSLSLLPDYAYGAAWGDMDNDGDLDLAIANGSTGLPPGTEGSLNEIWINAGPPPDGTNGRFKPLLTGPITTDKDETYNVAWADVNGDGFLDLLWVNRFQVNVMYLNNGAGNFTKVTTGPFVTDPGTSRDLAVGDLDNDGDTDIVVANSDGEHNFIYINQGGAQHGVEGTFLRLANDPAADDTGDTYGVSLADYDKDGDLDLFASRRLGGGNMLYRNDGTAHFQKMVNLAPSLDSSDSYRSAWGDLDRDGDLDLIVANREASNFYYINNGDGTFTKIDFGEVPQYVGNARAVCIADLDGDSLPDVLFANTLGDSDFYYRNHGRTWKDLGFAYYPSTSTPRLLASGTLAPASTTTYQVTTGPALTGAVMIAGFNTVFAPFKGGTLVPAPEIVIPGFTTDAAGELSINVHFPDGVPAGITIYHQMWFVDGTSPTGFSSSNGLSGLTP